MNSRPVYETAAHRRIQDDVASVLERYWNMRVLPSPALHSFDWVVVHKDGRVAFAEFKARNMTIHASRDGIMLSVKKVRRLLEECQRLRGVCAIFVVLARNGLYTTRLKSPETYGILEGGRTTHTRDRFDREPVVHISCDQFELVTNSVRYEPITAGTGRMIG